jgi:hypothetical protein
MRFSFVVPFLLASQFCLAQINTTIIDNKICIKTSPIALVDAWGGYSYRLGAEFKVIDNTAFSFELGKYYGLGQKLSLKIHPNGFIIRPEIKCYLNKYKLSTGPYVSLDVFYKKINFDYTDSIHFSSTPTFEKQYSIWKDIYGINGKYGVLIVHKKKLVVEWYVGGGVRFIKGHNSLTAEEDKNVLTGEGHGDLISDGQRAIKGVWPNIMIGFKIGYSVKSKVFKLVNSKMI